MAGGAIEEAHHKVEVTEEEEGIVKSSVRMSNRTGRSKQERDIFFNRITKEGERKRIY